MSTTYVDYLQEARVDMLRTHGPAAHTGELAEEVVVVRHEVQYVAPLAFRFKPVSIECWVTELRIASFTMAYEIFQEDPDRPGERLVHVRATTVLTPYVFATERPRRLSGVERETLGVFLEPRERTPRQKPTPVPREKVGHYPVHVRFSDVDVYGHVNNVLVPGGRILLQSPALARPRRLGPLGGGRPAGRGLQDPDPVPARDADRWSSVTRVGERSMTIESEISTATPCSPGRGR